LIALQDGQRIDPVLGGDVAHRGQRIAFVEHAVEDHGHDPVAKLPVDRLTVVPIAVHVGFQATYVSRSVGGGVRPDLSRAFLTGVLIALHDHVPLQSAARMDDCASTSATAVSSEGRRVATTITVSMGRRVASTSTAFGSMMNTEAVRAWRAG